MCMKDVQVKLNEPMHSTVQWFYTIVLVSTDGEAPVINGADPTHCYVPSTNEQFKYDNQSIAEGLVLKEMGEVCNAHWVEST